MLTAECFVLKERPTSNEKIETGGSADSRHHRGLRGRAHQEYRDRGSECGRRDGGRGPDSRRLLSTLPQQGTPGLGSALRSRGEDDHDPWTVYGKGRLQRRRRWLPVQISS